LQIPAGFLAMARGYCVPQNGWARLLRTNLGANERRQGCAGKSCPARQIYWPASTAWHAYASPPRLFSACRVRVTTFASLWRFLKSAGRLGLMVTAPLALPIQEATCVT